MAVVKDDSLLCDRKLPCWHLRLRLVVVKMKGVREDLVDQVHAHAEVSLIINESCVRVESCACRNNYFSHNKFLAVIFSPSWALGENISLPNKTRYTVFY